LAEKKIARPVTTSPRILSQIDLLRMAKNGDTSASKEIIDRLNNRTSEEGQSRE